MFARPTRRAPGPVPYSLGAVGLLAALALVCALPLPGIAAGTKINLVQGSAGMVWMPVLVARQLNFFGDEGLDVNYIITGGGAKSMAALVTGAADFAATTMTDAINARKQGADVRVVAALLRQYPADCVIRKDVAGKAGVSPSSPVADRIRALRNLKIGLGGQGSPADQLIVWLAKRGGLDPNRDVERLFLGTDQAVLAALQNRAIDAFCYGPPTSTRAVVSGDAVYLFHIVGGRDLPEISHFPNAVLVTSDKFIRTNRDTVDKVARAYVRAVWFMDREPAKVGSVIKPLFQNMDQATFEASLAAARVGFPGDPILQPNDVRAVISFLRDNTGEAVNVSAEELLDNSPIRRAVDALRNKQ